MLSRGLVVDSIDRDATGENDFTASHFLGKPADVLGTQDVGVEVLFFLVARLPVNRCEVDHDVERIGLAFQLAIFPDISLNDGQAAIFKEWL